MTRTTIVQHSWLGACGEGRVLRCEVLANHTSDVSPLAIEIARRNASCLLDDRGARLALVQSRSRNEIFESFPTLYEAVDFLISNPPYLLHSDEISDLYRDNMPAEAIYAPDEAGLFFYEKMAAGLPALLRSGGLASSGGEDAAGWSGPGGLSTLRLPNRSVRQGIA